MSNYQFDKFMSDIFALKGTPWYRWHPQIALRYLPAVKFIKKQKTKNKKRELSILEVGSGGLGIAPYLKMPVTGVDTEFVPPFHPLLHRVVGDATKLQFNNDSFDIAICIDMLEHLPQSKRQLAIMEIVRVTKKLLIIGVPCGKLAAEHDQKTRDNYINRHKTGYKFADEHIKYGLPEAVDILNYIEKAAKQRQKKIKVTVKGNFNLGLRRFLMWGWASRNIFVNILFRKAFLLLIPIFRWLDKEPYYRLIFFVTIE